MFGLHGRRECPLTWRFLARELEIGARQTNWLRYSMLNQESGKVRAQKEIRIGPAQRYRPRSPKKRQTTKPGF